MVSDLRLHCLPRSHSLNVRLKWTERTYVSPKDEELWCDIVASYSSLVDILVGEQFTFSLVCRTCCLSLNLKQLGNNVIRLYVLSELQHPGAFIRINIIMVSSF